MKLKFVVLLIVLSLLGAAHLPVSTGAGRFVRPLCEIPWIQRTILFTVTITLHESSFPLYCRAGSYDTMKYHGTRRHSHET